MIIVSLFEFLNKRIIIKFTDGDELTGLVIHHTVAGDNDPEEESISFIPESGVMKNQEAEIMEHEIKSIKIIGD